MVSQTGAVGGRLGGVAPVGAKHTAGRSSAAVQADFRKALDGAIQTGREVHLSAHATQRLRQRNLELSSSDIERVSRAAEKLASKGGRQSLVMMGSVSLILDVRTRTVVTAMERRSMEADIFTNIDSAAFA